MSKKANAGVAIVFTTVKAINAESVRLGDNAKTWQKDMHVLNLSVAHHLAKHGQIGVLNHHLGQFKDALGVRRNAIIAWFTAFAACTFDDKNQTFMFKKDHKLDLTAANEKPFWKFSGNETGKDDVQVFDVMGDIAKMYKRLKAKHDEETKSGVRSEHYNRNAQLLSALAMMQAGVVPTVAKDISPEGAPLPLQAPGNGDPLDTPVPMHA